MPRITRVKKAQPRYRMVPVLDENGRPKVTPVMRRNGEPKVKAKTGTPITRRVTEPDKTQPLPNRKCGKCSEEIKVGDAYLWWAIRSPGSASGYKSYRCSKPDCYPKPWETEGNPKRAALMQAQDALENDLAADFESTDDVESALSAFAETVREIAQEMIDGADNIESGFGHATSTSDELRERGENLESQADEIESVDLPDVPERDDFEGEHNTDCDTCDGTGKVPESEEEDAEEVKCETCDGTGEVRDEEAEQAAFDEALEEWREECRSNANDAAGEVDLG